MLVTSAGGGDCPVCGATNGTCTGLPHTGQPVDLPAVKEHPMGAVRKYRVNFRGRERVMKLSEADLKNYPGAVPVDVPVDDEANTDTTQAKSRPAANKSRTAANKTE